MIPPRPSTRACVAAAPGAGHRHRGRLRAWLPAVLLALLAAAAVPVASAQAGAEAAVPVRDPPDRVGRLSALSGPVERIEEDALGPGRDLTAPATLNWPVTSGQAYATGHRGRAEVRIGTLALRLDGDTEVEFPRIDDQVVQMIVVHGTLSLRVRNRALLPELDLTTPRERIVLDDPGSYRIDVDRVPLTTTVSAYTGLARLATRAVTYTIRGGQRGVLGGPEARFRLAAPVADAFDDWVAAQDRRDDALRSTRYVAAETTGVESLDEHGQWRSFGALGDAWIPTTVPPGWAPYRRGHWAWVAPWGWSWVDEAPWGFTPFHYGRWVLVSGTWAWLPGRRDLRPVYAPALVAWYGGIAGAGSEAVVGWFPLGPGEVYLPAYDSSLRYLERINLAHGATGRPRPGAEHPVHYLFQRSPIAVTWVDRAHLEAREGVQSHLRAPPPQWIANAASYLPAPPPAPRTGPETARSPAADARPPARSEVAPATAGARRPNAPSRPQRASGLAPVGAAEAPGDARH